MSYKGRQLSSGNYLKLDDLSPQFNGTQKTFNLTTGGQAFYPGSAFSIIVVLGGVVQEPESAYTIDQSQINFAAAPGPLDDFFCITLGIALSIGVPADGTVTYSKLAPSARGVGIQSNGVTIGVGVSQLNFIGDSNTLYYNSSTNTVDITGTGAESSSDLVGLSTLGFFSDNQNITSNTTLPSNTLLYTVHKNINVGSGVTLTIGSGSTVFLDRFNNLDNVRVKSITSPFIMSYNRISENFIVSKNYNAMSVGPILTIDDGVVITVELDAHWTIIPSL